MPSDNHHNDGLTRSRTGLGSILHRTVSTDSRAGGDALVCDGFSLPDLDAASDAPPAYGDLHDQMQFSQPGIQAGARVTDDGRVNININQKTSRFAELLAPALRQQGTGDSQASDAPLPPPYIPPGLAGEPGQPPPPPMNIAIQIVGSRGDVQPFVALGKVLLEYGHRVRLATHATFQKFVEDAGLEFFNIGGDPAELMAFMVKNPGLMPGFDALKTGEVSKRRRGIQEILLGCWRSCIEAGNGLGPPPKRHPVGQPAEPSEAYLPGDPAQRPFVADAIIANPPSFAHIHIAEKLGIPLHMMFTMPWSPTRAFPHPLANIQSSNTDAVLTSYMSYALVEMMTWQGLGDVINRFRTKALDLEPISLIWAPGLLTRLRIPYTYCWSPALIPKPNDWGKEIDISGFYFLNLASSFTPEPDLAGFLEAGPPPVYIGFGSIVVDDPDALTKMIFEAVESTGVRALVSKGWGGLGAESVGLPENVFMLGNVPHDWLFKHVSAVCHHGGAGTSAAGIQAGKPTIVVPFFGDQPFWGAMVERAGAGPAPIPYKSLTAEKLADAIRHCMKPDTQARAQELGDRIREEKGTEEGGKSFHRHLAIDDLRCSLAPSHTAAWRVRRTKVRLSPFAAAVLVKNGQIKYSDLKLYRPKEYHTEEQPWDPITGTTCALVADITAIGMAIADVPRELFKTRPKSKKSTSSSKLPSPEENTSKQSLVSDGAASRSSVPLNDVASASNAMAVVPSSDTASERVPAETPTEVPVSGSTSLLTDRSSILSGPDSSSQAEITTIDSAEPGKRATAAPSINESLSSAPDDRAGSRPLSPSGPRMEATVERAMAAGESVSRIVTTGVKSPMNFCLGLARGFRNVPRLYGDDMVRPVEKVHDLPSGIRVASKEFALGFYDGLSGLAMQPLKGAEKEGGVGLVKGFGKGIGGLVLKPAAGIWALPAYTMQGAHASIRNIFASSVQNYIIASRIKQGDLNFERSIAEEQKDVLLRWNKIKFELRKWQALKMIERKEQERRDRAAREARGEPPVPAPTSSSSSSAQPSAETQFVEPQTGWSRTKNLSFDERKALHARKQAWQKHHIDAKIKAPPPPLPPRSDTGSRPVSSSRSSLAEDEEFERAIRASVAETSRGNEADDARVEEAIRASVNNLRRAGHGLPQPSTDAKPGVDDLSITDEEYQELIEHAIQQSIALQTAGIHGEDDLGFLDDDEEFKRALEQSKLLDTKGAAGAGLLYDSENDEDLKRAIEASTSHEQQQQQQQVHPPPVNTQTTPEETNDKPPQQTPAGEEEEEFNKAIEASKAAHEDKLQREAAAKTEEDIVMEYVKKQSLAEEEFRRRAAKGKMKAADEGGSGDEDDEELKRAVEESLRMGGEGNSTGEGNGERAG